jgi:hypothetical protein
MRVDAAPARFGLPCGFRGTSPSRRGASIEIVTKSFAGIEQAVERRRLVFPARGHGDV